MEDDVLEQPALPESGDAGNTAADSNKVADDHDLDDDLEPDSPEHPEEEDDEIEVDGKKFVMPKSAVEKLKSERLMHADYTQKTQSVAEDRKAVAAEREQVVRQQQEAQQYIDEIAEVRSIEKQLKAYESLDWIEMSQNDPGGTQQLDLQRRALEAARNTAVQAITQKQQANALTEQQNLAKQVQDADAYFKREIPGWSEERSIRLQQFAIEQGIPAAVLGQAVIRQPALAKILHQAEMFSQLEKKQLTKPKAPAAPPAPVTRVGASRAAAKVDPAKMTDAQWYEQRNKTRKS